MAFRLAKVAVLVLCVALLAGCATPAATPAPAAPKPTAPSVVEKAEPSAATTSAQPAPQQPTPEPEPAPEETPAEPTQDLNATSTSEVYEPVYDVLLDETVLPVYAPDTFTFDVKPGYDVLEVTGQYKAPVVFVAATDIVLKDGAGKEVLHYAGLPDGYAEFWFGGSTVSFSIGILREPTPGKYTMTVSTTGTETGLGVKVAGEAGGAPDFPYLEVTNRTMGALHDLRGKAVVLDLMATWCGPCQDAMPGLGRIQRDYGGRVMVVSISMDPADTPEMIQQMKQEYGGPWTFAYDTEGLARGHYDAGLFPSYAVIDAHNNLLYRSTGASESDLRHWLDVGLAD